MLNKKISSLIVSSLLTVTILSSCSSSDTSTNVPVPQPTISSTENSKSEDAKIVAQKYETLLQSVLSLDETKLKTIFEESQKLSETSTEEEKSKFLTLIETEVPAFKIIYTEEMSSDQKGYVYINLLNYAGALIGNNMVLTVHVPVEAVTVDGENATVAVDQITSTEDVDIKSVLGDADPTFFKKNNEWFFLNTAA